jgi:formylglycine-generating enzyme required for sulfatase activity
MTRFWTWGKGVKMKLALIPAGKFTMGANDEMCPSNREAPPHAVSLTKPYFLGVYEVTQEEYEAVTGENPSKFKDPRNPVDSVSWTAAVEFCKKLSQTAGRTVRLPTEAE